ncbi:PQQ-binding-like beta-propeller repeat protein [Streptomyces sp. NPDC002994]|uniref:protein kinase domain-containing protein n=1 Tax=Streptomyces sp. NPDC002994 TaxID=3154441 RepID=UPI0033B37B8B
MLSPLTHDDPAALDGYRLIARLGSGGMGTVYLARAATGRTVALKTMHARIATDPTFRSRFRLETDAARIIGDRHGAAVFDADPQAETPWLATEYVLGPPLDDAVELCGPLPEPSVRALGAALAGALAQLHSSDVVHRDLKPSNVMITAYGPKVIDFGIARAAGDDRLTRTGAAAGTPAFMSPEQATGREHTPAGDVFALAGVLLFAATGHGPFGGGQAADLLYRVRYAEPDLLDVPPSLLPLLTACLSKDPSQRPTTHRIAAELHDGHGDFADHLPDLLLAEIARRATEVWHHQPYRLPAPAESSLAPTTPDGPRSLSRRRLLTVGGGSVLGVGAAGVGAWAWLAPGAEKTPQGGGTASPASPSAKSAQGRDRQPLWKTEAFDREESLTPLLAGDVVGFMETAEFRVLDPKDGKELWTSGLHTDPQEIASDGTHFYGSRSNTAQNALAIHTFAPRNGTAPGRVIELKGFEGSGFGTQLLTAAGGLLFAASRIGKSDDSFEKKETGWHLVAVNLRTGKEAWRRPIPRHLPENESRLYLAKVVGGRLILGKLNGERTDFEMEARDTRTGIRLWQRSIPVSPDDYFLIPGQLATDSRHVYVGGRRLRALRLTDGSSAWEVGQGKALYGVPTVAGGLVYVTEGDRGLIAVSANKGERKWEEAPAARDLTPVLNTVPVVGKKYVYAPVMGGLSAVDLATRTSQWVFPTDATRYVVDKGRTRIIGAGETSAVAFPLA